VPEINDLESSVHSIAKFGDFSTIGFTMIGLGEPREVRAGVVGGNYFDVMGLKPVLGRLIGPQDDGPKAAGVVVLTYGFWSTAFNRDPSVIGKTVRLGSIGDRSATVIGVLEPSIPYPADTEIIANIVTSPHHLSATMVTGRVHRMTELFGQLAPGASLEQARSELRTAYANMQKDHAEAYPPHDDYEIKVRMLRDQVTSGARTVLLVLLAASGLVFIIACCNVANLILARTVRREGELAIRAALGAGTGALRRMLLADSLLLCGAGAALGLISAQPLVAILARYASRFSVRAAGLTVDWSMLWVGAGLAIVAAVILAFVPPLPSAERSNGLNVSGGIRITSSTKRNQRIFAVTQIAASFVLLAGAAMLVTTLIALQRTQTGMNTREVLAIDVPAMSYGKTPEQVIDFYKEAMRRVEALPGVVKTAYGDVAPWRDASVFGPGLQFSGDGHMHVPGQEDPRAEPRTISPGFFSALDVPLIEGRDFNELDGRPGSEPVVIVSETLAQRMFPNEDALNRHVYWTDPVLQFIPGTKEEKARFMAPHRIIGIVQDVDDEHAVPEPTATIYEMFDAGFMFGGHLFIHTSVNPYSLVMPVTRTIRQMSAEQPVEHAATLQDIRAEVLAPNRLNSLVFGVFAAVALLIAVVGVAGVLAFSVSARTREFGIRMALGSEPRRILKGVIREGAMMALVGVLAGGALGYAAARLVSSYVLEMQTPGVLPVVLSALVLVAAAVVASTLPAARAARVDVIQALRAE
jgi:predicted permease